MMNKNKPFFLAHPGAYPMAMKQQNVSVKRKKRATDMVKMSFSGRIISEEL